jgi:iron complex transport system ATP-binding protein
VVAVAQAVNQMKAPLLEVDELWVHAGPRRLAGPLSFRVELGQFWCLVGPNGSGKTLLLQALSMAGGAAARTARLGGRLLGEWPLAELACWRGLVPQQLHDTFAAPVLDVVLQGRHPHLSRWAWEGQTDRAMALACLERVGLSGFAYRDVLTLSGGERQRVAIATLLLQDPPLALLDEPLAHLDLAQQIRILDLLTEVRATGGRAVIMSVHDLSLAQRVATHAIVLGGAKPLAGPIDEILDGETLTSVFGHPLSRHSALGRTWWLPH